MINLSHVGVKSLEGKQTIGQSGLGFSCLGIRPQCASYLNTWAQFICSRQENWAVQQFQGNKFCVCWMQPLFAS